MFRDIATNILMSALIQKGNMDLKDLHKHAIHARKYNEKLLRKIVKAGENCEYGRKYNFKNIKTIEDYRRNVPITTFKDYEPYINRMIENNEEQILTSTPLIGYAQTSGTTGKHKFIPLTQPVVECYKKYTLTLMIALANKYKRERTGKGLKLSRGDFLFADFGSVLPNGRPASNVAESPAKQFGFIFPYIINVPFTSLFKVNDIDRNYLSLRFGLENKDNLYIFGIFFTSVSDLFVYLKDNWETLLEDIEKGTISDLSCATDETREKLYKVIKPNPQRAAELRIEFEKGFDDTIVERIWPNLSVIYGIGTAIFSPYAKNVRRYARDVPFDHSIYGASEGLFAAADELNTERRLLLPDSVFFEFIPVDDEDSIYLIDELEPGREYEMVITNQAGLYRYRFGDIVRVESYLGECPYIIFSHRKGNLINVTGEKTSEAHVNEAVSRISDKARCTIQDWILYINTSTQPSHYTLVIENNEGMDLTPYADFANQALGEANLRFRYWQDAHELGTLTLLNQEPGTHAAWKKHMVEKGTAPQQVKPVHILDTPEKEEFFLSRIR